MSSLSSISRNIILGISFSAFIPGVFGLIFNIIIFSRKKFRCQPCAFYFFYATISNLYIVFVILPVRILSNGYSISLSSTNRGICKFETYSFNMMRVLSCWLIALACVDRYFHSSPHTQIRRLSSMKSARILTGITTIFIIISYIHLFIYYDVVSTVNNLGIVIYSSCYSQNSSYNTFFGIWHMVFYSLCPTFLMILFGCLTVNNIRQQRQVMAVNVVNNPVRRYTNLHLLRMLTAQVLVIIVSTLPFSIMRLYYLSTPDVVRTPEQQTIEYITNSVVTTIPYFAHATSFYLYTLTGTVFRKEFIKIIIYCLSHTRVTQAFITQISGQTAQ